MVLKTDDISIYGIDGAMHDITDLTDDLKIEVLGSSMTGMILVFCKIDIYVYMLYAHSEKYQKASVTIG